MNLSRNGPVPGAAAAVAAFYKGPWRQGPAAGQHPPLLPEPKEGRP
jgi:hypothetical protein